MSRSHVRTARHSAGRVVLTLLWRSRNVDETNMKQITLTSANECRYSSTLGVLLDDKAYVACASLEHFTAPDVGELLCCDTTQSYRNQTLMQSRPTSSA